MTVDVRLQQFTGPLDALLTLIQEKQLIISEVSLSEVTEQYVAYIEALEEAVPDDLADFLVVATKLVLLKSKALLPQLLPDEDDGPSLEEQLRLYKTFVDVSKKLVKLWEEQRLSLYHIEPPRPMTEFVLPTNVTGDALHQSMVRLIKRLTPLKPLPQTQIDKAVSVKEKIKQIAETLRTLRRTGFFDLVENKQNKTEIIVSFLAILELVKQQLVSLRQDQAFGDIDIEAVDS